MHILLPRSKRRSPWRLAPPARWRRLLCLCLAFALAACGQQEAGGLNVSAAEVERAVSDGDARTLAQLKSIKVGPKPTGFRKDPYACVRGDELPKTIKALEARLGDKR